jgi:leader peptidase (prepilin peptidase)/N-methyltransferase
VSSIDLFGWVGFGVGLLFGSFLNVCIARLPKHESVVRPGSRCLACGHAVRWYDNLPVLSWLVLRGKCRDCGVGISWSYPAVELGVGFWGYLAGVEMWHAWYVAGFIAVRRGFEDVFFNSAAVLGFAILGFLLIGLMVMDWQTQRLPDAFTLTGIGVGLFVVCVQAVFLGPGEDAVVLDSAHQLRLSSPGSFASQGNLFITGPEALIFGRMLAVVGAGLLLWAIGWIYKAVRKRDGMGLGDVKMLAMIAAFVGFWGAVVALFVGALAASIYAIGLMARGKAGAASRLPFGSFLAVGGLVAAVFGQQLVGWYGGLLR